MIKEETNTGINKNPDYARIVIETSEVIGLDFKEACYDMLSSILNIMDELQDVENIDKEKLFNDIERALILSLQPKSKK